MSQTFDTPLFSSDQSIGRVLNAGLPVVLIFLNGAAPAPLDQAMKALAKREAGKLLVVQLDVKDSPETVQRYNIHSTSAVVTVKNGQVQSQSENITGEELERHANFLLGRGPKPEPKVQQASNAYTGAGSGADSGANNGYRSASQPAYSQTVNGQSGQSMIVTDATFDQEVMRSSIPVVVDFWAPWCGPCRMVAPTLDKLAREWSGRVKIAKVNVDENPQVAGRYGVTGIPTMMVVRGGQVIDQWAGALPEGPLRQRLSRVIG